LSFNELRGGLGILVALGVSAAAGAILDQHPNDEEKESDKT